MFATWRLAGSSCGCAWTERDNSTDDKNRSSVVPRLLEQDEQLDRTHCGPAWLQDPRVASMVVEALLYGETVRRFYELHAWVVMPNHVHVVFQPHTELSSIMRWLKGRTGRVANQILDRTGTPFWQNESFDHWIRSAEEFRYLIEYVENNPLKAGLVEAKEQWRWSSAGWAGLAGAAGTTDDKNRSSILPRG